MFQKREIGIIKIFGIKLVIDPSWVWIFILITWSFAAGILPRVAPNKAIIFYISLSLVASLLFFLSVVIHEFFHSIVARRNGLKVEKITLFFFGGASNLPEEPTSAPVELKMAIAGPLSSFVLAGLFFLLSKFVGNTLFATIFDTLGVVNLALAGFNLLPGFPLDGGRIFRAILWRVGDNFEWATKIATDFGKLTAFFMIIAGIFEAIFINLLSGIWLVLIGFFLLRAAEVSYQQSLILPILKRKMVSEIMEKDILVNKNDVIFPSVDINSTALEALSVLSNGADIVLVENGGEVVGYITIESFKKVLDNYSS